MLTCGLVFPKITLTLAAIHFVGRILFTIGYRVSPKARMIGAPFVMLTSMALVVLVVVATAYMTTFVC